MEIQTLFNFLNDMRENAKQELEERWEKWEKDFAVNEVHEVIGGLLARQVMIFMKFSESPSMWNWHIAPIILRTMIDTHITIAWILCDPLVRSQKYIAYGLGQTKLEIEHRKKQLEETGQDEEQEQFIGALERWLNSQRWSFLTEVNVGSWSGLNTRKMAEEAGIIDFYNYCYTPFSAGTHSQWHHVSRFNLTRCSRPLHRYHMVPAVDDDHTQVQPVILVAKYMWKSFKAFDEQFDVKIQTESTYNKLTDWLYSEDDSNESES